jgi:hypothetical protein
MWQTLRHALIILFCLFHMAAVAAYAIPSPAADRFSSWIRTRITPKVRPYLLVTSQWQQWNMFSPDPIRVVTRYVIERRDGDAWIEHRAIDADSVSWWRHAASMKALDRLLEQKPSLVPLREYFLRFFCADEELASGGALRLVYLTSFIPYHRKLQTISWWRAWKPEWTSTADVEISCAT